MIKLTFVLQMTKGYCHGNQLILGANKYM